jgi:hypothetical protein
MSLARASRSLLNGLSLSSERELGATPMGLAGSGATKMAWAWFALLVIVAGFLTGPVGAVLLLVVALAIGGLTVGIAALLDWLLPQR